MKSFLMLAMVLFAFMACQNPKKPNAANRVAEMTELSLQVTGMTCGGCENTVINAISQLDGVQDVTASFEDEGVKLFYDPTRVSPEIIKGAIVSTGYKVEDENDDATE